MVQFIRKNLFIKLLLFALFIGVAWAGFGHSHEDEHEHQGCDVCKLVNDIAGACFLADIISLISAILIRNLFSPFFKISNPYFYNSLPTRAPPTFS